MEWVRFSLTAPKKKISYSSSFVDWPYIGDRKDVIPVKDVKPDKKRNKV